MKKQMKQIGFYEGLPLTDKNSFLEKLAETPVPKKKELLVEISAVSVNPVDVKFRMQTPKQESFTVLGFDAVGRIVAKGPQSENFEIGDRIYYAGSAKQPGSNQEYQLVDERIVAKAPENLTDEASAALPLTAITAYELLFEKFQLIPKESANKGKKILVINGAGGVGSILTQLAKWSGLEVVATASPKNFQWLKENGVDHPIDYHQELKPQLEKVGISTVDVVAVLHDIRPYLTELAEMIQPMGKIGMIVGLDGPIDIASFKNLSVSFEWEYMFTKTDYGQLIETQGEILKHLTALVEEEKIHTTLGKVYREGISKETLKQATKEVETGKVHGKVVITGGFASNEIATEK